MSKYSCGAAIFICSKRAYSARIFDDKLGQPSGLVLVVHNGVAGNEFKPVALAAQATDLVVLGEFRPVKGIDVLIDAIASLHRDGLPATATLVGDGPDMAALSAQVAHGGLADAIRFAPPMPARAAIAKTIADPSAMDEITERLRAQVAVAFSADAMMDGVIAGYEQAIRRVPALSGALLAHA